MCWIIAVILALTVVMLLAEDYGRPSWVDPRARQRFGVHLEPAGGRAHLNAMGLLRRRFLHLAAGAAALPALSRIASAQAYPTQSAVVGVVDSLNVRGSIPVLPCIHKPHTVSIVWTLQGRP